MEEWLVKYEECKEADKLAASLSSPKERNSENFLKYKNAVDQSWRLGEELHLIQETLTEEEKIKVNEIIGGAIAEGFISALFSR
jgi:hypothetical protein